MRHFISRLYKKSKVINFPFYIARRYLFSKKTHNAINIISGISTGGVALATMALICTLSVFNGFQDMAASLFTAFDPQLKITPVSGKTTRIDDPLLDIARRDTDVLYFTECLEENALLVHQDLQIMITVKGVDDNFTKVTDIEKHLYGDGDFSLHEGALNYGILGVQITQRLGFGSYFPDALNIYAPKKGQRINMANPMSSFNKEELYSAGVAFAVNQTKYDANYILTSLPLAQSLFSQQGRISSLELRLHDNAKIEEVKERLTKQLGSIYTIKDRYEQQEDVFKIMKIEKLIAYIFLTFILIIASFNIIGSVSTLIIDKKEDVQTLRNLGANNKQIVQIFLFEGRMIAVFGAFIGILMGVVLCWLQQNYGFISLGGSTSHFVIDAYPVSVKISDILVVFGTVLTVGALAVWYPVHYLSKKLL